MYDATTYGTNWATVYNAKNPVPRQDQSTPSLPGLSRAIQRNERYHLHHQHQ